MEKRNYDVVVIGGGTTGVCAAVAAARGGAKVAVVDSNGFLGGNACNGMAWYGFHSLDFTQVVAGVPSEIIQRLREIGGAGEFCPDPVAGSMVWVNSTLLKLTLTKMCIENKIDIYLHCMLTNVVKCSAYEQEVIIQSKLNSIMMSSRVLIDCTDSGDAAVAAGAVWHRGRCADGKMQVASTTLFIRGVDMEEMLDYFDEHPDQLRPIPVPDEELRRLTKRMREATVFGMGAFPDIIARAKQEGLTDYPRDRLVGQAFPKINELLLVASRVEDADPTDIDAYTKAELTALLQTEATVKLLRDYIPGCKNAYVCGSGHHIGLRETIHVHGDLTLTEEDLLTGKEFSDCIARGAYHLDIHSPDHQGIETGHPPIYQIPYRALLPKGVEGIIVAGRAASMTQAAQASTRVIPIAGAIGQAAGTAAAIAFKDGVSPRQVDTAKLRQMLKEGNAIL